MWLEEKYVLKAWDKWQASATGDDFNTFIPNLIATMNLLPYLIQTISAHVV